MEASAEESSARGFREKVLAADYEAQRNVAPFLENPVLRRIVKTFTNDERGDFAKWACNPRVLEMLREAKKAMDEGRLTEKEVEHIMVGSLTRRKATEGSTSPTSDATRGGASADIGQRQVPVETGNLVSALNEHVQLRMLGNQLYESQSFVEALQKYTEALSIVNLVRGTNDGDQGEIDKNRMATLMNIAAVNMATQDFGAAISRLTEANRILPNHPKLLMRRARAFTERGDFANARADIDVVASFRIQGFKREIERAREEVTRAEQEVREEPLDGFLFNPNPKTLKP